MTKKYFLLMLALALFALVLVGCQASNADTQDTAIDETAEEYPEIMAVFETDDGILSMIYPEGWAIDQVPVEVGTAFGIVPRPEQLETDSVSLFDEPVVMVYGYTQQVGPDFASQDNLTTFHILTFYDDNASFDYEVVGEPAIINDEDVMTYITQAESTLSSGVHTNWMLATAMVDQTVVVYAVGLPDSAMDKYGQMAMDMFNSVQINTEITGGLVD